MTEWDCPACGDTLCMEVRGKVFVELSTGMRQPDKFDHNDTVHWICEACANKLVEQLKGGGFDNDV